MTEKTARAGKRATSQKSLFRNISKGDLVTIQDVAGGRRGHAVGREYGNWVLVLERNRGTALATKDNTVAVSKPNRVAEPPKVGQCLTYDDGRISTGKVVEVGSGSMYVLFDNSIEPTLIHFDDPEWMDYITFEG
jgi:hypothetical protein